MRGLALAFVLGACTEPAPLSLVVSTFNTGTTSGLAHDAQPDDGYTSKEAALSDRWYGDGLAWRPAIDAVQAFFAREQPALATFQELFHPRHCHEIPDEAKEGFVCETWKEGDPSVIEQALGPGYQIACHPGKDDKCAAVHSTVGRFRGCEGAFCLEGLTGFRVPDCGGGARVARGLVDLADGRTLALVSVHGSSGVNEGDRACRAAQFEQVFVDLGDGQPGASGDLNLIMGDFNTDPGRLAGFDESAAKILEHAGPGQRFHFATELGDDATPTYAGLVNIDHVLGDHLRGRCWAAGVTEGHPAVIDAVYFDHRPIVCTLTERAIP